MFSPKTVFVVGAGASRDFGFPTGDDLRLEIVRVLTGFLPQNFSTDCQFCAAVLKKSNGRMARLGQYQSAAQRLISALPLAISIDNLLHAHRNDSEMVFLGKLAICHVILSKENQSPLFYESENIRDKVQNINFESSSINASWYLPLMRLLNMGKDLEMVQTIFENIAFIIWNYDRCIEHFLVNSIMKYFNVSEKIAISAMNELRIIHPYGQVGKLPWQEISGVETKFGEKYPNLQEISDSILTFTESAEEGVRQRAVDLVQGAETLVFMGFGYLPQNVKLMTVDSHSNVKRIFSTTYGVGERDVPIIESELSEMIKRYAWFKGKVSFPGRQEPEFRFYDEPGTCRDLMDHNWLRLTRQQVKM